MAAFRDDEAVLEMQCGYDTKATVCKAGGLWVGWRLECGDGKAQGVSGSTEMGGNGWWMFCQGCRLQELMQGGWTVVAACSPNVNKT